MLEKLEVGKGYFNSDNRTVKTLFVDDKSVFYEVVTDGTRTYVDTKFALKRWAELPKPKKRYWLWDVKYNTNCIFRSTIYMDDNGRASDGDIAFNKDMLIKKHESEFIEVNA